MQDTSSAAWKMKKEKDTDIIPLDSVTELTQLTTNLTADTNPVMSPDGKKILFVSQKQGNDDIFLTDINAQAHQQITVSPSNDRNPTWTPDGKSLLFDSDRLGFSAIFRIDLDNTRIVKHVVVRGTNDYDPDVSPDGTKIAFSTGDGILCCANIDGGKVYQIAEGTNPQWSPKGYQILFTSKKSGNMDIWMVNPDGQDLTQLTIDTAEDKSPSWSPNGKTVVFASERTGNFDLWLLDFTSNNLIQLTNHPGDDENPVWSPDGKYIYFDSEKGKNINLWRLTPR